MGPWVVWAVKSGASSPMRSVTTSLVWVDMKEPPWESVGTGSIARRTAPGTAAESFWTLGEALAGRGVQAMSSGPPPAPPSRPPDIGRRRPTGPTADAHRVADPRGLYLRWPPFSADRG